LDGDQVVEIHIAWWSIEAQGEWEFIGAFVSKVQAELALDFEKDFDNDDDIEYGVTTLEVTV
jgi:hypothetical protein